MGEHFCDQQRDHGPIHGNEPYQDAEKGATEAKSMEDRITEPLTMTTAKNISMNSVPICQPQDTSHKLQH